MTVFCVTDFILAQRQQENADTLELDCDRWSRGIQELSCALGQVEGPGWHPLVETWALAGLWVGWPPGFQGDIWKVGSISLCLQARLSNLKHVAYNAPWEDSYF